jgi:DNA invertase Pin-like site-specific DNA recombinase
MMGVDDSSASLANVLKSILSSIYENQTKSISIAGIRALLIAILIVLIWVGISNEFIKHVSEVLIWTLYNRTDSLVLDSGLSTWSYYKVPNEWWIFWVLPLVGFAGIDFEEAKERVDKVIKYLRVSSESQQDKSGKDRQQNPIEKEIEKLDVEEIVTIADDWESARTMLRDNIEEILNIVSEDEDSTFCLMVEDVDRLSRAELFEACVFFWIAKELGLIFYFDKMGYFDFSDPGQQLAAFFGLYQSRRELLKISERTSSGQKSVKEDGGLPGPAPYGYEKEDDSNIIHICDKEAEVIRDGVSILLDTDDAIAAVWEELKDKYNDKEHTVPSYATFLNILRRELYTGKILHEGEVAGECPPIISDEKFEAIQQAIGEKSREQRDEELDHALKSVIERFGVDTSLELFDVIKGQCPDCEGDVETWGSTKRWGHRVLRYRCEEEDCDFKGPLLSEKLLQEWENKLPITCPLCQTPASKDDWKKSKTKIKAIEQTCDECGCEYSINLTEECMDDLKRGLEFPEYAIRWFTKEKKDSEESNANSTSDTESNKDNEDDDQRDLDDFN